MSGHGDTNRDSADGGREHGRRSSIEQVLLEGIEKLNLSANRLTLEKSLMQTEAGREKLIDELKRETRARDIIINTLREAYLRDIVAIKDQLVRATKLQEEGEKRVDIESQLNSQVDEPPQSNPETEIAQGSKAGGSGVKEQQRGVPTKLLNDMIPSLDFTGPLRFFTPHDSHELIFDPCQQCGGTIQLRIVPPPTDYRLRALRRKLEKVHAGKMAEKQEEVEEAKRGGRYLADTLRAEVLRLESEKMRIEKERQVAFASVERLRKTPQYDKVVKDLHRLQRFADEETERFKNESETAANRIANLEAQAAEFKASLKDVRKKCDEASNESRARGARIEQLDESLKASEARGRSKDEQIQTLKTDLVKANRKLQEAQGETNKVSNSMEALREQLTSIVKKAERRAKLAEGQQAYLENSLKEEKQQRVLERLSSTVNTWRLSQIRLRWSQWRREAFAGGAAADRDRREKEEQEREKSDMAKVAEIESLRNRASLASGFSVGSWRRKKTWTKCPCQRPFRLRWFNHCSLKVALDPSLHRVVSARAR